MSDERVYFAYCAEALLRSVRGRMTPSLHQKLAALELSPERPPLPAYEHARWSQIIAMTGQELLPGLGPQEQHHEVGVWLTEAFLDNFIGQALKPVIRVIGMRRTLGRMRQNLRVANNYAESEVVDVAPGHARLRINEPGLMGYFYRGIFARGLQLTGAAGLSVELSSQDADGTSYEIRWPP